MSVFNPDEIQLDAPGTAQGEDVTAWLADYFSGDGPVSSMTVGLTATLSANLDSARFEAWLSEDRGNDNDDRGADSLSSSNSDAADSFFGAPPQDFASATDFSGTHGIFGNSAATSIWLDSGPVQQVPVSSHVGDGASAAQDLIFLDFTSFAKGGNKGGPGGGGGGGGDGGDPNVLSKYTSGDSNVADGSEYNILVDFKGTWTSDLQEAFLDAADLLSSLITDDIADVFFRGKVIDDITITAELSDIDGVGGILGQAGPTAIRTADYLPATAIMQFDSADAASYFAIDNGVDIDGVAFNTDGTADVDTLWDVIVLHEMLHSIGFGTIWGYKGLIADAGTENPSFIGAGAMEEYGNNPVPVEGSYGAGTNDSHWDEATFGSEMMTGFIGTADDPTQNYLSDMTIASLEDLGYQTVWETQLIA